MEDLRTLVRDAEELLKATAGDMSGKANELRERLKVAVDNAKVTYQRLQDKARDKAVESSKAADRVIREYPYQSIGIAFGVGLLIGVLVNRR